MASPVEVKAEKPKGKKVLAEIRIKPALGGGHVIEHHYEGYQHDPRPYKFGANDGQKAIAHIARHAGLPMQGAEATGEEE